MKKKQAGFALVLSLVLLLVMSLMGGALIVIVSSDHSKNTSNDRYMQTFYVAETALLEGERYIVNQFKGDWLNGALRDTQNRFLPNNIVAIWDGQMTEINYDSNVFFDTNDIARTLCYNSFRDPDRATFDIVVAHSYNFGQFFRDSLSASALDTFNINIDDLDRYYYEYFIRQIGSAPYRGSGSSVKKTAGDDSTNGIAYRIYGCGIYIEDREDPDTSMFIVPLESVIILPK